ncbi:MAG: twin-arginine translocase subunit TatC [Planctomycetes bacterium]|nr:twin-arginine translocase subunit TatC [Planctomycetota bacterium]
MAQDLEGTRMTLGEHLNELRRRLFYSVIALSICFGTAWWYKEYLTDYVMWPWKDAVARINGDLTVAAEQQLKDHPEFPRSKFFTSDDPANTELRDKLDDRMVMLGVGESFFFALNISLYFSIFAAGPFVLFQIWAFVAAGLYRHEKSAVLKYFPFSVILFLTGVYFCYRWVIPVGMYFLSTTLPLDQVQPQMTLDNYFSFLSTMCLAMGCIFQLPLVMLFLSKLGLIQATTYGKYRGHFLIGALFVAAVVTPGPDYYSQILMTIPMVVLYEIGILLARFTARAPAKE